MTDEPACRSERHGPELIRATAAFAVEHRGLSWFLTLSTAVLMLGTLLIALLAPSLVIAIPATLLGALLIVRMFVIYHDYQHGAILRQSRIARPLMAFFGLCILAPSSVWKASHDYHHRNNSRLRSAHIGSFPIMTTESWARAGFSQRLAYRFIRHPLTIACAYPLAFLYAMCIAPFLRNPKRHWDGLAAVVVHLAIAVGLFQVAGWSGVLFALVIPCAIACAVGSYLFYAQHNFPDVVFHVDDGWTYHAAAMESSSYLRMGPVLRFFTANIGYHHIHHLNARVPFYRLPALMAAMPELQHPATTSLSLPDIWRCLRLALWDPEAGKMVGYR